VIGPQIQKAIATRSPSLPSPGPSGDVPSNGRSPSFATHLSEALSGHPGPSAGPTPKDGKRPVKGGADAGPSEVPTAAPPAATRPSAFQAPLGTSSRRPDEAAASDQPLAESHHVQPSAMDSQSASPPHELESARILGTFGVLSESATAARPEAGAQVDDQMIGNQIEPATHSSPQPQPASTPDDKAQTVPYAGPLDASSFTQTELGPAMLQQGQEAAPERATGCTRLENCEKGGTTSEQQSIVLGVGIPNGVDIAGPQSFGTVLTSLEAAQASSGNDGFGSQPGVGQTRQHPGPSLAATAKEATGNEVNNRDEST
jgi:hypothetical protein